MQYGFVPEAPSVVIHFGNPHLDSRADRLYLLLCLPWLPVFLSDCSSPTHPKTRPTCDRKHHRLVRCLSMSAFGSSRTKLRRLIFSRQSFIALLLVHTVLFISLGRSSQWSSHIPLLSKPPAVAPERMTNTPPLPPLSKRIPCYGPRGKLLSNSPDDALDEVELKIRMQYSDLMSRDDLTIFLFHC